MDQVIQKPISKKAPKVKSAKAITQPRERVIIYDDTMVWQASLPTTELIHNLPAKCRYVPDIDQERKVCSGICGFGLTILATFLLLPVLRGINVGIIIGFAAVLGGMPGAAIGYVWGPRLVGRKPFWIIRRRWNEDDKNYTIEPIVHSFLMGEANSFRNPENPQPGVFLGTSWYNNVEARAIRRFFTAQASTTMQKIQLTAFIVMAAALVTVVFFLAAMASD